MSAALMLPALAGADEDAVRALYASYRAAWLKNDADTPRAVLALFTEDAALLPHHGDPIVTPKSAIADQWFPNGKLYGRVERYEQQVERVEVRGELGYLFGRFTLAFSFDGRRTEATGNQLMVARLTPDGWRIAALIWNDPPPAT